MKFYEKQVNKKQLKIKSSKMGSMKKAMSSKMNKNGPLLPATRFGDMPKGKLLKSKRVNLRDYI